jgi:hypothetical protein
MAIQKTIDIINKTFIGPIRARITPAIENMMEASPLFMSWLLGANSQGFRFKDNPKTGTVRQPNPGGQGGAGDFWAILDHDLGSRFRVTI